MLWLSLLLPSMKKIRSKLKALEWPQHKTRVVRGSDYSPASELFARLRKTMTGNNPKLDLVNVDAHKKIGQILSICSQDIEQKQNSDINQGPKLCQNFAKKYGQQSQARSCKCCCAYKIWSDSVNSFSRY